MRIAIAINKAWNIYNFRRGIIKALIEAGHEVIAIAPFDDYVARIEELGCQFVHYPISDTGSNPLEELKAIYRLRKILKMSHVNILLTYTIKMNLYGTVASRILGIPVICNVSGLGTAFLASTLSARIARMLSAIILRHSTFLFFQNQDDQREFLEATGISRDQCGLLPGSGINLDEFDFKTLPIPGRYQFIMLSRLILEKGVIEYVEAARIVKNKLPEIKFALVGSLDESHTRSIDKSKLDQWISDGLVDYCPHSDDIKAHMLSAECVVLPSYREGLPRVLLEGGALGRVLITTDVAGCKEVVINGQNGYLCKSQDSLSLSDRLIEYLHLTQEQKQIMGKESRKIVEERFSETIVVEAYLDKIATYA